MEGLIFGILRYSISVLCCNHEMFCFAYSCLDLSDDAQKAKLKLQAVSCLMSIVMLFDVHLVISISLTCFSCKILKMQAYFACARQKGVPGVPSRVCGSWRMVA